MPFTYEMELPTEQELDVTEIKMSMAALYAGALHLGKVCEEKNNEFVLCKSELKDPRKCIQEGKDVTKCALEFFQNIKRECRKEFEQFAECLQKGSSNWAYSNCRKTQEVFDKCMLDKLDVKKPPLGWNSEIHVHKTQREKPVEEPEFYPGSADKYVTPKEKLPSKYPTPF